MAIKTGTILKAFLTDDPALLERLDRGEPALTELWSVIMYRIMRLELRENAKLSMDVEGPLMRALTEIEQEEKPPE